MSGVARQIAIDGGRFQPKLETVGNTSLAGSAGRSAIAGNLQVRVATALLKHACAMRIWSEVIYDRAKTKWPRSFELWDVDIKKAYWKARDAEKTYYLRAIEHRKKAIESYNKAIQQIRDSVRQDKDKEIKGIEEEIRKCQDQIKLCTHGANQHEQSDEGQLPYRILPPGELKKDAELYDRVFASALAACANNGGIKLWEAQINDEFSKIQNWEKDRQEHHHVPLSYGDAYRNTLWNQFYADQVKNSSKAPEPKPVRRDWADMAARPPPPVQAPQGPPAAGNPNGRVVLALRRQRP